MSALLGVEVVAAQSPAQVVDGADVIVCATNSNVPVLDGDWRVPGQHVTSIVSSNIALLKRGFVNQMRREIDERTLERADVLMTNVWGRKNWTRRRSFGKPHSTARSLRARSSTPGRSSAARKAGEPTILKSLNFKNCAFWGIGAAAIAGLISDKLLKQRKGLILDFNPHEFYDDSWTEEC